MCNFLCKNYWRSSKHAKLWHKCRPELTMEEINEEIRLAREEMVYLKNTEWFTSKIWNKKPQKHRIAYEMNKSFNTWQTAHLENMGNDKTTVKILKSVWGFVAIYLYLCRR